MEEERRILELDIGDTNLAEFMESNRGLMVAEVISATEELVYKDLEKIDVIRIKMQLPHGKTVLNCSLVNKEAVDGLDKVLEWALENEEYEMCHRIKLLTEYINKPKEDVRRKTRGRAKKTK